MSLPIHFECTGQVRRIGHVRYVAVLFPVLPFVLLLSLLTLLARLLCLRLRPWTSKEGSAALLLGRDPAAIPE